MSDSTEYVLRQELRTLQIMNDSKSREISHLNDWIERLKKEKEDIRKSTLLRAAEIVRQRGDEIGGAINPEITVQAILKEAEGEI